MSESKNIFDKKYLSSSLDRWNSPNDSEILKKLFQKCEFDIKIDEVSNDGDVIFYINQSNIGIEDDDLKKYPLIKSSFFSNFIGEFLVRQNINKFVKFLIKMNGDEYKKKVCKFNHRNFGMFFCSKSKTFRFQFHISLIQDILVEEINQLVGVKK